MGIGYLFHTSEGKRFVVTMTVKMIEDNKKKIILYSNMLNVYKRALQFRFYMEYEFIMESTTFASSTCSSFSLSSFSSASSISNSVTA